MKFQAENTTITQWNEEEHRYETILAKDEKKPLEEGPVPNTPFHVRVGLRTEAGHGFINGDGDYTRLETVPELKLWIFSGNAVINVKEAELSTPFFNQDGENRFTTDTLREVNLRADIIGPLTDALTPRFMNVDNDARVSVVTKFLPGEKFEDGTRDPAWLPGLATDLLLLRHGPLDTMVSLHASMHLDPDLLSQGTYLPRLAEVKLRDGWYLGPTDGSVQVDLTAEAGLGAEVLRQQPDAPLENLEDRLKLRGFVGVELTISGRAPQAPQPKR